MPELESKGEVRSEQKTLLLDIRKATDREIIKRMLGDIMPSEAIEQLLFAFDQLDQVDYTNRCLDATKALAEILNTRFGEEESFFDLIPEANFLDVRSDGPLEKVHYSGKYHDAAILEWRAGKHSVPYALLIDPTYNTVNRMSDKPWLMMTNAGATDEFLPKVNAHYGGDWRIELRYQKERGIFVSTENAMPSSKKKK